MRLLVSLIGVSVLMIAASVVANAQDQPSSGDPAAGRAFALKTCTPCHLVAPDQSIPEAFTVAPSFEDIAHTRGMTISALHAFLATSHPTMPNLILSPQESDDVIAYILSLRSRS